MPDRHWLLGMSRGVPRGVFRSRPWRGWRSRLPRLGRSRGQVPGDSVSWAWLEPYPDAPPGPAAATMSLAFVAALQQLPPRERAALILSDVLGFDPAEVVGILDCDPADLGPLLLRARAAVDGLSAAADGEEAVVARFTGAFERGDLAAITALLTRDAWLRMRPVPVQYRGRSAARHFLAAVAFPGGTPSYRLVPIRANGQPAFGCYLRDAASGIAHACGLVVLTVNGGRIAAIDRFVDNSVLPRFGLPRTLPEGLSATDG